MFDTPKVTIKIETDLNYMDVNLYHNVNLLVGGSGDNKTNFINAIYDSMSDYIASNREEGLVSVTGIDNKGNNVEYEINRINSLGDVPVLYDGKDHSGRLVLKLSEMPYSLYLIDDVRGIYYDKDFRNFLKGSCEKCVFIFACRDLDVPPFSGEMASKGCFSCFVESVYSVKVEEEDFHTTYSLVEYCNKVLEKNKNAIYYGKVDTCISECGNYSGEYQFLKNFFPNVIPSEGKDNVCSVLERYIEKSSKKGIAYLFVDMCAFGANFYELCKLLFKYPNFTVIICNYYSYEYTILKVVFDDINLVASYTGDYNNALDGNFETFETCVSQVLAKEKYGLCTSFRKGSVPKLLSRYSGKSCDECCNSSYKKSKCDRNCTKEDFVKMIASKDVEVEEFVKCSKEGHKYV